MKNYKKRTRLNIIKQFAEKLLIDIFVIIGMLSVLGWSINVFKEAGEFYFSTKKVSFSIENVSELSRESNQRNNSGKNEVMPREVDGQLVSVSQIADKIFMLESSCGKNNYSKCEAIGKFNRYGYGIDGNGTYQCFEKGEDRKAVISWIKEHKKEGLNDRQIVCHYNIGTITEDCDYANKFLSLQ